MTNCIGIIGAGSWGTALAQTLATHGHNILLWTRRETVAKAINTKHEGPALPGIRLHDRIKATANHSDITTCSLLLYVLPAQVLRSYLTDYPPAPHQTLVIAAKGIEISTGKLMSEVAQELIPDTPIAILTGPNFAREVAYNLPAASTIACRDEQRLMHLQKTLSTRTFRLYPTTDIVGAQCGGALKNVIAIGCGAVDGLKLGDNARAAVITRGAAEIARLTSALGGHRETLMGLCGMGDLILTCTSTQSRNYRFGLSLADGDVHDISLETTVEGVHTAQAIITLAGERHTEMPICVAVAACVSGQLSVQQAVDTLLQRPIRGSEYE